jgi:hypothetical protein
VEAFWDADGEVRVVVGCPSPDVEGAEPPDFDLFSVEEGELDAFENGINDFSSLGEGDVSNLCHFTGEGISMPFEFRH